MFRICGNSREFSIFFIYEGLCTVINCRRKIRQFSNINVFGREKIPTTLFDFSFVSFSARLETYRICLGQESFRRITFSYEIFEILCILIVWNTIRQFNFALRLFVSKRKQLDFRTLNSSFAMSWYSRRYFLIWNAVRLLHHIFWRWSYSCHPQRVFGDKTFFQWKMRNLISL